MDARALLPTLAALLLGLPGAAAAPVVEAYATVASADACVSFDPAQPVWSACQPPADQGPGADREGLGGIVIGVVVAGKPVCLGLQPNGGGLAFCNPLCGKKNGEGILCDPNIRVTLA